MYMYILDGLKELSCGNGTRFEVQGVPEKIRLCLKTYTLNSHSQLCTLTRNCVLHFDHKRDTISPE